MVGISLRSQGLGGRLPTHGWAVKEAVFPFAKLPGVDMLLGPEMKSTGEVMGLGRDFSEAFCKAQLAVHQRVPAGGMAFVSVRDADKAEACRLAAKLVATGFRLCATHGTAAALRAHGLDCQGVNKVREGAPHVVERIAAGDVDFIINTTQGKQAIADSYTIRRTALQHQVFYTTTMAGAAAAVAAMQTDRTPRVIQLQQLYTAEAFPTEVRDHHE